jgi:hypothetical protein
MASKIKVDNIENQCGGAVVTKCGATTTISGSVVKADDIQAADGGNLINQCGTTITLGASGDTINLASGASQTGFGRTGTVDWDTTAKTASFTAVSGNGYFVNTTSGAVTVTLPAGSAGDIVGISDYASTFQTNNLTITPNGTDKINGTNDNATLSTQGIAVSLVYVDVTRGWKSVTGSDNDTTGVTPSAFVTATGGTITTSGDFKIHTFTGPGTFCVSCAGNPAGSNTVDYLVVAGGGSGGGTGGSSRSGAGGGAGGYRESPGTASGSYGVSPLGVSPAVALPVPATGYPITVGGGGANGGPETKGANGSNSIFSTITSTGGGAGGSRGGVECGSSGGSGGGGVANAGAGTGNTPSVHQVVVVEQQLLVEQELVDQVTLVDQVEQVQQVQLIQHLQQELVAVEQVVVVMVQLQIHHMQVVLVVLVVVEQVVKQDVMEMQAQLTLVVVEVELEQILEDVVDLEDQV